MNTNLKLKAGILSYDDLFHWFTDKTSVDKHISWLDEDLAQITFPNNDYIIDIGWYPSRDAAGSFAVIVVKNNDWSNYLFQKNTRSYNGLIDAINKAVEFIYHEHRNHHDQQIVNS